MFSSRLMMKFVSLNPRGISLLYRVPFLRWRIFFNLLKLVWLSPLAVCFSYCAVSFDRLSPAGHCTVKVQVMSTQTDPVRHPSCRLLCTQIADVTNNRHVLLICALIWYICTVSVHILKISDSVKRIKSPFKGPPSFFLMIKTWALVALIKRLCRFSLCRSKANHCGLGVRRQWSNFHVGVCESLFPLVYKDRFLRSCVPNEDLSAIGCFRLQVVECDKFPEQTTLLVPSLHPAKPAMSMAKGRWGSNTVFQP